MSEESKNRSPKMPKVIIPVIVLILILIVVLLLIRNCDGNGYDNSGTSSGDQAGESMTSMVSMPSATSTADSTSMQLPQKGDEFIWGKYEQDGNTSNGEEDIAWLVLDTTDDSALLLSVKNLDTLRYNDAQGAPTTWETCTLRSWLNEDFIETAFSADEMSKILLTSISTADNAVFGTDGGNDTTDKIFLLSIEEVLEYFTSDEERLAVNTDHARSKGAYDYGGWGNWWLRSPGTNSSAVRTISCFDGTSSDSGTQAWDDINAVRPALWVKFD